MKRLALFTAALMILSFGLANAQDVCDLAGAPTGAWDGDTKVNTGVPVTFTIHITVGTANVTGGTNGFEVYLNQDQSSVADPAGTFQPITFGTLIDLTVDYWDGGFFTNEFSIDGAGADTIGFGGFSLFKPGIVVGFDEDVYTITTQVDGALDGTGNFLCIDTAFYPPGSPWLWSTTAGNVFPDWGGPYCYEIATIPNLPPVFDNCPASQASFDHCVTATYDFDATDPEGDPFTFSMVTGPGMIDAATGVWSYNPTLGDVGAPIDVEVLVADAFGGTICAFQLVFTNEAPIVTCQGTVPIGKGNPVDVQITADDVDCDPGTYSILGVVPAPVGTFSIDANTGVLTFNTDDADGGTTFAFEVEYTDGNLADVCTQNIEVLVTEPYEVQIEKTHNTFQGSHEYVDVSVNLGSEDMWGFDMLIAYDASALSFQAAMPGSVYDACGWEYFTYRYGPNGNCGNACPSGLLRVVGLAETNNGANHPSCFNATGETLFTLDFLVTDDRTFECMYVPVRFFWMDCGDNTVSFHPSEDTENPYSQKLAISRFVYDLEGAMEMSDGGAEFPTYLGAPDVCLDGDKDVPVRFIDFVNGGIDIVCADSIDDRGDINLNGQAYEISDAVLYSNYFVFGMGVFDNPPAQIAASDVNADGLPLSVADLVYLIRVVVGDALPYPKLSPVAANITSNGSILSSDIDLGAAFVVVEGQASPELLIDGVEMYSAYNAAENVTNVLVVGMNRDAAINGEFLNAGGSIVSMEMATYDGAPVNAKVVPTEFTLNQNYPNPFNPSTTVSFGLPTASDYTLTIYNVTGQVVRTLSDRADAGMVELSIDLSDQASGIYFYSVDAGKYSETKKMVLIK